MNLINWKEWSIRVLFWYSTVIFFYVTLKLNWQKILKKIKFPVTINLNKVYFILLHTCLELYSFIWCVHLKYKKQDRFCNIDSSLYNFFHNCVRLSIKCLNLKKSLFSNNCLNYLTILRINFFQGKILVNIVQHYL